MAYPIAINSLVRRQAAAGGAAALCGDSGGRSGRCS